MEPDDPRHSKVIQAKICLLGDFAVGKTSLVRQFVEGRFDEKYLSTIGVKVSRKILKRPYLDLHFLLWDLAGGERFTRYEENYLRGAAGALIACDLTRLETLEYLPHYAGQFLIANPHASVVFLGNKADLVDQWEISEQELEESSALMGGPHLLTSAKTGQGVEAAFEQLASQIEARHGINPSG